MCLSNVIKKQINVETLKSNQNKYRPYYNKINTKIKMLLNNNNHINQNVSKNLSHNIRAQAPL